MLWGGNQIKASQQYLSTTLSLPIVLFTGHTYELSRINTSFQTFSTHTWVYVHLWSWLLGFKIFNEIILCTFFSMNTFYWGFPSGSVVKNLSAMHDGLGQSLGQEDSFSQEDPLQVDMATHSGILAWKIPWREEPSRLRSMGSQKSWTQLSDWTIVFYYLGNTSLEIFSKQNTFILVHGL